MIEQLTDKQLHALTRLREEFKPHQISKLPKPTKAQTEALQKDYRCGTRCGLCGGWHHPDVIHLDYVGHAAATDRLLEVDPVWYWEPMALENGLPKLDKDGGLWGRLTVCGMTRIGYGSAGDKKGGDAIKELIGDLIRNAGMRFGMALTLWHKGELHSNEKPEAAQRLPSLTDEQAIKLWKKANSNLASRPGNLSVLIGNFVEAVKAKYALTPAQEELLLNLKPEVTI
jgi:hypothetical protein